MKKDLLHELNIPEQCARYHVSLWSCPHFLFIIMGFVIIFAILATFFAAERYATPEVTIIIVPGVTAILFAISHIIIRSFEQMAEASRAKAEFVSIASHQLRSPLTSMKWQLEMLIKNPVSAVNTREHLEMLNKQNNTMLRLVNDLLAVNRIDSNQLSLSLKPLSLSAITNAVLEMHQDAARVAKVMFSLKDTYNEVPSIIGDEVYTQWVIQNLIDNAIRYSYPDTEIIISMKKEKNYVRWCITNTGITIPPEDAKYIFEKFFRAHTSMKWQTEGSGLGLYVAKAIVKNSGGVINFSSDNVHDQTTFWFKLPIAENQSPLYSIKRNVTI